MEAKKRELLNKLDDIDRLQCIDVLDYLASLKRCGHRGQTKREIYFNFYGLISDRAVRSQIERLTKYKLIKEIIIKYGNHEIKIYEHI